jgi:hypothetical protein
MKRLRITLFIILLAVGAGLVACDEASPSPIPPINNPSEPSDPSGPSEPEPSNPSEPSEPSEPGGPSNPNEPSNPDEPSEPSEPSGPDNKSNDGFAELTEGLGVGASVSVTLSYTMTGNRNDLPGDVISYFLAEFRLQTASNRSLKAISMLRVPDRLKEAMDDATEFRGELKLYGTLLEVGENRVIQGTATIETGELAGLMMDIFVTSDRTGFDSDAGNDWFDASITGATESRLLLDLKDRQFIANVFALTEREEAQFGIPVDFGPARLYFSAENAETIFGTSILGNGFLMLEDGESIPVMMLALGFQAPSVPAEEELLVLHCTDCEGQALEVMQRKYLKATNWHRELRSRFAIPAWVLNQERIPLPDEPRCEELLPLMAEALNGSQYFRYYYYTLRDGASYVTVDERNIMSEFAVGSREHSDARVFYFTAMQNAFDNLLLIHSTRCAE